MQSTMATVSPVLKTSITKSDRSTNDKLRFYVKRELNADDKNSKSRQVLYDLFMTSCQHELDYQELVTDHLSLGCFCRTAIINSAVILETDNESDSVRAMLENMTFTPADAVSVGEYLKNLQRKTCGNEAKASVRKVTEAKFQCPHHRQIIGDRVFTQPLSAVQKLISPYMTQFNDSQLIECVTELKYRFINIGDVLVHANFTADNIVAKTQCVSNVVAFGSELSHCGNGVYDGALFVADLLLWHYIHESGGDNEERKSYCYTLQQSVYEFVTTVLADLDLDCDKFNEKMLMSVMTGFVGIHMLFRVMDGDWNSKLPISHTGVRDDILGCAYRLISSYKTIHSINSLLMIGLMLA